MIHSAFLNPFDVSGYHFINHFAGRSSVFDWSMIFFASYAPEMYAVLFVIAWFTLPKTEEKQRNALIVSVVGGIFALVINVIIGHIWFRPRPFTVLPKGSFTQLISHPADASFPSDHASGSFGFTSGVWGRGPIWLQYVFTIIGILVLIARVFVGVHWPTDVLGGLVIGTICGRLSGMFHRITMPITRLGMRICRMSPSGDSNASSTSING